MKKYLEFIKESKSKDTSYLFLDIDGCLLPILDNREDEYVTDFYPEAIKFLSKLQDKYDLKIVISSSWRDYKSYRWIKHKFEDYGIKIYDTTSNHPKHKRSEQIKSWIEDNVKNCKSFAIIDDGHDDINKEFPNNFIKIDSKIGFTKDYYYEKVKEILG